MDLDATFECPVAGAIWARAKQASIVGQSQGSLESGVAGKIIAVVGDKITVQWSGIPIDKTFSVLEQVQGWSIVPPWAQYQADVLNSAETVEFRLFGHESTQAGSLYRTVVELGARARATTDLTADNVKLAILDKFKTMNIQSPDTGALLKYYGTWSATDEGWTNVATLLKNADGNCDAWAKFLIQILEVQGFADSNQIDIRARFTENYKGLATAGKFPDLYVKNWAPVKPSLDPEKSAKPVFNNYPPGPLRNADKRAYNWIAKSVVAQPGTLGQGGSKPPQDFKDHQIVQLSLGGKTILFDPSYGGNPYTGGSLQDQANAFATRSLSYLGFNSTGVKRLVVFWVPVDFKYVQIIATVRPK